MSVAWWRDYDPAFVQDRSDVQVELIKKAFEEAGLPIGEHRDDSNMVDYLYRPGVVLTRDEDADRVYRALGLEGPPEKGSDRTPQQSAGLHVVELADDAKAVPDVLEDLDTRLGVGVATPDHLIHVTDKAKVTWCMSKEPAPSAADGVPSFSGNEESNGRTGLVVVVDTGSLEEVIGEHAWLTGVTGEEEPATVGHYTGHGTFIAGVVRTYAPAADVRVLAVLSIGGAAFESDVVNGLTRALDLAPDVINLSAGTRTRRDVPLLSFEVFWEQRLSQLKGTVLVAAAGNDGDRGPFWPAAFPWAVSVGALDESADERAGFSNYGSWVDVYALGTDVANAYPAGDYTYREPPLTDQTTTFDGIAIWSGTSFAAPMVAGLAVGRMTWSGESARGSVDSLLRIAKANAGVGVGARLRSADDATRSADLP
jgi:hypothetical protein